MKLHRDLLSFAIPTFFGYSRPLQSRQHLCGLINKLTRTLFHFGGLSPALRMIGAKKTIAAAKVDLTGRCVRQSL
jgi:hypothetical protein